jgi:hypothetical protein
MGSEIVLARLGHYFDAGNGSCSTALIVDVIDDGETLGPDVNVQAWHHGGEPFSRTSVVVVDAPTAADDRNSFHLTRDCPWGR